MRQIKTGQTGFSIIGLVLIAIIIGLISFAGWFIYNRQNKTEERIIASANKANLSDAEHNRWNDEKISSNWLQRQSENASIKVPDGFDILANSFDTFDFWLPDQPIGSLKYVKSTPAKVIGEPQKHFELGIIVSYNKEGFNDRGDVIEEFNTYSGLPVTVKLFEQTTQPDGLDFPKGAKHLKYMATKGDDYINVDYVYFETGYKDIVDEMVKTADIK